MGSYDVYAIFILSIKQTNYKKLLDMTKILSGSFFYFLLDAKGTTEEIIVSFCLLLPFFVILDCRTTLSLFV